MIIILGYINAIIYLAIYFIIYTSDKELTLISVYITKNIYFFREQIFSGAKINSSYCDLIEEDGALIISTH